MKFQILLAIVILSCYCSMTTAEVVEDVEGLAAEVANKANFLLEECSTFQGCYAGCSWLNTCSIFKDHCKAKCGVKCHCHHSAANANFKLTGIHYAFAVLSFLIALRTTL